VVDAPTGQPAGAATLAVSRDGSVVLVSGAGGSGLLAVRETATGRETRLDPAALGGKLYFPEWAPDGRAVVATLATGDENPYTVTDGSIVVLPYDGGQLGPARVVVAGDTGAFHFYPTWSPDGQWIAFVSAPAPGRSYDNPQARLRLVSRAGDRVIELGNAGGGAGASWPRLAPAAVAQAGGNLLFLIFSSRRAYGFLSRAGAGPQLWLSTIDLRRVASGDPSSAAVWLPFQDYHVANLRGVWAERLVCGAQSPCPDGARCEGGRCVAADR
jgi:hypothetical protein